MLIHIYAGILVALIYTHLNIYTTYFAQVQRKTFTCLLIAVCQYGWRPCSIWISFDPLWVHRSEITPILACYALEHRWEGKLPIIVLINLRWRCCWVSAKVWNKISERLYISLAYFFIDLGSKFDWELQLSKYVDM